MFNDTERVVHDLDHRYGLGYDRLTDGLAEIPPVGQPICDQAPSDALDQARAAVDAADAAAEAAQTGERAYDRDDGDTDGAEDGAGEADSSTDSDGRD
ncbi:hypothetical protein [Pseudonocardia humida]|uniref:Uncharacterized protein n=1 Tax=Pseudonocardia humida TaxID=2800819 RepID=A0ABT1A540_9PSEU|nr:hypothetical protein [Pseudonocardia humida]MCO1658117.1 hypothetical protein [Pseudonocardia humida]